MARGQAKLFWDGVSLLWCQTANLNRDKKETPQPFLPSDVHPYRDAEEYKPAPKKRAKNPNPAKRLKLRSLGRVPDGK